jgi:hypothetical protein
MALGSQLIKLKLVNKKIPFRRVQPLRFPRMLLGAQPLQQEFALTERLAVMNQIGLLPLIHVR